jgi:hypothetical protein
MGYTDSVKRISIASLLLAASAACGGGEALPTGPSPVTAEVEFRYVLAEGAASSLATELPCAGQVRLRPSFWAFSQVTMVPVGPGSWGARFEEIPVGRHFLRIAVPEACGGGDLYANGVPLSDAGPTRGFTVHPDGSVEP